MEESSAFSHVVFTFFALWAIGKFVVYAKKYQLPINLNKRKKYKLYNDLHIINLDPTNIKTLRSLVEKKDTISLAQFLAVKQTTIVEICEYLSILRKQLTNILGVSASQASETQKLAAIKKVHLPDNPLRESFLELDQSELCILVEHDENTPPIIDEKLISQFGGSLFMEYFIIYSHLSLEEPAIFHIPPDNKLRVLFETLVNTNIALQGKQIKLKDRLKLFHLAQLNQIAVNVKINGFFQTKDEAIIALSNKSKAENYFAKHYELEDVFKLTPATIDKQAVEREWAVYNTYAKILCRLPTA